jgi:chemotaxis family two-component system response regulator Rcp1
MKINTSLEIPVEQVSYPNGASLHLPVPSAEWRRSGPLRVLLVDDDEADVYLIRRALAGNADVGEIVVAHDGVEALEMLDRASACPDLAIVDLKMPRKDGFTLLREIASRPHARFPAVVLSSSRSGADIYRAKKRGAVTFLSKPNSVEKLKTVLDHVISRFQ